MISRQKVLRQRDSYDSTDVIGSPWHADDLVLPPMRDVGRYGDGVWTFTPDRSSGRPTCIEFCDPDMFPDAEWELTARELTMALLGRRPGREQLARSRNKPISVAMSIRRVGTLSRWAAATGFGLPDQWTDATVDAFIAAYNNSRLPNRVAGYNPKSEAGTRQTLAAYLTVITMLHEHRPQLSHGMRARPWSRWPAVGANEIAGVVVHDEGRTAIIEPEVWWAAVRAALRILREWSPEVIPAWTAYHRAVAARTLPWGPEAQRSFDVWAQDPRSVLPVDRHGQVSWDTIGNWCGIDWRPDQISRRGNEAAARLVAEGRTTQSWWPRPEGPTHDTAPRWLGHMDTDDVFTFAALVRNAALVVLAALSTMRDSELQELRRGCVEFHDGSWALRSTVQKQQAQPQPAVWWVTPLAVAAVGVLEDLVRPIDVFVLASDGTHAPSDHLVCTLNRKHGYGRAGLAGSGRPFRRFVEWVDSHADQFGFEPIGSVISGHQFRRTFAVVAAWQPDGHVAVELQLKDTADVAAGYYANHDRKWFEAYEFAKAEAHAARTATYIDDCSPPELAGPGGPSFAAKAFAAHSAGAHPLLTAMDSRDAREQSASLLAGSHSCGDGWDCAGDNRHARCVAVQSVLAPTTVSPPQLSSGLCFDLGAGLDGACRNVILDPAAHLAFWDVEAQRLTREVACEHRTLFRKRLELELDDARACIAAMEAACRRQPRRLARRFDDERLRLLERLADDAHAPGTAALYRPVLIAQEERITWLAALETGQT